MITIKVPYTFRNGIHVDFTIQKNIKNPIAKAEWNIAITKEFWKAIEKEYYLECVPVVFQQIADFTGENTLWVDKYGIYPPQTFIPQNKN